MVRSIAAIGFAVCLVAAVACSTGEIGAAASGNANDVATLAEPVPSHDVAPAAIDPNTPTFAVDVEPIIQAHCQNCHRDKGIAPFPLVSYEDVSAHALTAQQKVTSREMPPWGAFDVIGPTGDSDPETCKMQHKLTDDLRLTEDQISIISRWVDGGMPMGDASKRPAARTSFPNATIKGATQYQIAAPYKVTADGPDDIRCFPIDPGLTEDTWVNATNVVPDQPSVVHHVIVYLDPSKHAVAKAGTAGSYQCFGGPNLGADGGGTTLLLAWAPGVPPTGLGQNNAAIKIPKGSGLVMQVHYHPTHETVVDQSKFELLKLPPTTTPEYVAIVQLAGNAKDAAGSNNGGRIKLLEGPDDPGNVPTFLIPSGKTAHTESMDITLPSVPVDLRLALVGSHMHWAGVNLKLTIERPTESEGQPKNECLLSTPKYDFNWQRGYQYDEPFEKLPKIAGGDKLHLTCTYNNSASNKNVKKAMDALPTNTPPTLHLGETTEDEMCLSALVILRQYIPGYD